MQLARNILFLAVLAVSLILPACDQKPRNPVSEYGDALMGARASSQQAAEAANLEAVRKSVAAYRAANDKYPDSLNDIESLLGSPLDLTKYDYDPQTGTVTPKS